MTAQHTPGPWFFCKQDDTDEDSEFFVMESNKYDWPNVVAETDREADARLIAAAPDLLEALQAIVRSLSDQDDEGMIEHAEPMIRARAAIQKATQGTHKEAP